MSTYISAVEKRRRSLALNPKLSMKLRLSALANMQQATAPFLCKLIRAAERAKNFRLVFHANERLAQIHQQAFERRLIAPTPAPERVPSSLD